MTMRAPGKAPAGGTGRRPPGARVSRSAAASRTGREREELALSPAARLTLALELSDLCDGLAAAGRRARKGRP